MALSIMIAEVERLAVEVTELTHETKLEANRRALEERRRRLRLHGVSNHRANRPFSFLERELWPFHSPGCVFRL